MRTIQKEIITTLNVQPSIDPLREIERRIEFLSDHLASTKRRGYVLGISGGQDSLLAGILAQRAVEKSREAGRDARFHAVLLPYGKQTDRADAKKAINFIKPDEIHDINIKAGTDGIVGAYTKSKQHAIHDFDKGNIKARMRMIAQYTLASEHGLLVVGTDHAAEAVTGFFTKFGDGAADILPLFGLTKRQGRAMLRALNAPKLFMVKPPTADLLDTTPARSDEEELGISYNHIDDYLEGKHVPEEAATMIEERYRATAHKRSLPTTPDVVQ